MIGYSAPVCKSFAFSRRGTRPAGHFQIEPSNSVWLCSRCLSCAASNLPAQIDHRFDLVLSLAPSSVHEPRSNTAVISRRSPSSFFGPRSHSNPSITCCRCLFSTGRNESVSISLPPAVHEVVNFPLQLAILTSEFCSTADSLPLHRVVFVAFFNRLHHAIFHQPANTYFTQTAPSCRQHHLSLLFISARTVLYHATLAFR